MSHASSAVNAVNMIASPINLTRRASWAAITSKARSSNSSNTRSALGHDALGERCEPDEVDESDDETRTLERVDTLARARETTDRRFGVEAEQRVEPGADTRECLRREHAAI